MVERRVSVRRDDAPTPNRVSEIGSNRERATGSPTLLVVDDDPVVRLVARERLAAVGFEVVEADGGERGIEAFESSRPGLVLLDVEMPGVDGFGVCEAIRSIGAGREVPILIMTGLDDVESIQRAYQVGATDFVFKPLNWLVLEHRIRYMLRASKTFMDVLSQQMRLDEVQRHALLGSWEVEISSGSLSGSDSLWDMLGIHSDSLRTSASQLMARVHRDDREVLEQLIADTIRHRSAFSLDHRIIDAEGCERIVHSQGRIRVHDDPKHLIIDGFSQDITERRRTEDRVRYLASNDSLTGLANRDAFRDALRASIRQAIRSRSQIAVLFVDLDQFKQVNETFGHRAGDTFLKNVADTLVRSIRRPDVPLELPPGDHDIPIARLGGDEFCVLLEDLADPSDAGQMARSILESLARPVLVEGREILVTASIGIAIWPHDGEDGDSLLRNADSAMYHAKELGRAGFQFYRAALNAHALERLESLARLRRAIRDQAIEVHYQPKLELATGRITGCEALARWTDPERGAVPPMEFVPLAEANGLIGPLGEHVLRRACLAVRVWQERGYADLRLAVNLSAGQLKDERLVEIIDGVLRESHFDPGLLELEITESALIHNEAGARSVLTALKRRGIRISLDDFGTGFSSLAYLKRFPVETLKIDKSFIAGIGRGGEDEAITTAILSMSKDLGLRVVAEGIETEAQRLFLEQRACDEIQGYLVSRPLAAEDFGRFLDRHRAGIT
jgi:diguanylate cyclase (GGDEF)-like protein